MSSIISCRNRQLLLVDSSATDVFVLIRLTLSEATAFYDHETVWLFCTVLWIFSAFLTI